MLPIELLVVIAFGIDLLCGDPRWLPHPIRLIGYLAGKTEYFSRRRLENERAAGFLTVSVVLGLTGVVVLGLLKVGSAIHPLVGDLLSVYLLYTTFALKDLARHSGAVYDALADADIDLSRRQVAMIVGRETSRLDAEGVSRACVESVSENLVDGVTAPLFWAVIGGPLGAMLYKAVNTMDSMFGYKNEKYRKFGFIPARLDDLCNYLPARITAFIVVVISGTLGFDRTGSWRIWRRDRRKHASPNSAQTEAAFAGALDLRLGGPNHYFGSLVDKPYIGDLVVPAQPGHILKANRLMYGAAVVSLIFFALFRFVAERIANGMGI